MEFRITKCKSRETGTKIIREAAGKKDLENKAHLRRELLSSYRCYTKIIHPPGRQQWEKRKESSPSKAGEENESSDVIVTSDKALVGRTVLSWTSLILVCWALPIIARDCFLKMWRGLMKERLSLGKILFRL